MMKKKAVCFGEVLWDNFPTGPVPGGAPMNVAVRLQSLGMSARMVSKVGNDAPGRRLINFIRAGGVDVSLIQEDLQVPTGEVMVKLNAMGVAAYDIVYPSAWDRIGVTEQAVKAVGESDVLIFGSLVCRDRQSASTLIELLQHARFRVFDVNLRKPFVDFSMIRRLMDQADFIKMNDEELEEVMAMTDRRQGSLQEKMKALSELTGTQFICVTKGGDGAELFDGNNFFTHPGFKVEVADTVGSGDSFLAALLFQWLNQAPFEKALEFACATGALVATHKGANPLLDYQDIKSFIDRNRKD